MKLFLPVTIPILAVLAKGDVTAKVIPLPHVERGRSTYALRVYDILGREMFSNELGGDATINESLPVGSLPNGQYIISLLQGNEEAKTILSIEK
jgi:hypothetical protein